MRPLFSDAPVMPAPTTVSLPAPSSALAAALSGGRGNFSLPPPSLGIPLSSLMGLANAMKSQNTGTNLVQNSNGMWAPRDPNANPNVPQMPGPYPTPPLPTPMPYNPEMIQPSPPGQTLSWANGADPQTQQPAQSGLGPGMPTPGQPGQMDQFLAWLRAQRGM